MTKWKWILLAAVSLFLVGLGCTLVSGQITLVENFGSDIGSVDGTINRVAVDLTDNEDYKKHRDEIKSVEAFGFVVEVENLTGGEATGEGYLSLTDLGLSPSLEQLESHASKIFSNVDLPLGVGETARVVLEPARGIDLGEGRGRGVEAEVQGGVVGVVFDGRGRPLEVPQTSRSETVARWAGTLEAYPA